MFGGVYDEVDDEEELKGTFFNELVSLDLKNKQWRNVNLTGKKDLSVTKRRRRKQNENDDEGPSESEDEEEPAPAPAPAVVTDDDGIFTVSFSFSVLLSHKEFFLDFRIRIQNNIKRPEKWFRKNEIELIELKFNVHSKQTWPFFIIFVKIDS